VIIHHYAKVSNRNHHYLCKDFFEGIEIDTITPEYRLYQKNDTHFSGKGFLARKDDDGISNKPSYKTYSWFMPIS
jgi:hypothetical protein